MTFLPHNRLTRAPTDAWCNACLYQSRGELERKARFFYYEAGRGGAAPLCASHAAIFIAMAWANDERIDDANGAPIAAPTGLQAAIQVERAERRS
jgi:hypothetical protein